MIGYAIEVVDASAEIFEPNSVQEQGSKRDQSLRPTIFVPCRQTFKSSPLFHIGTTMVRTVVVTVDRDNDLGVKAGVRGPVIGRKATLTCNFETGIAIQKRAIQTQSWEHYTIMMN